MLAKTAVFIALLPKRLGRKGFAEGSLVESDPADYALSAAFKCSFGALAGRSKLKAIARPM